MATSILDANTPCDNQPVSASAAAFVRAFDEFYRLDNAADNNSETVDYALAHYAFEGAKECIVGRVIGDDHDIGAVAALVAYEKLECIMDGGYMVGNAQFADGDGRQELRAAQHALREQWRYHDRQGGRAARRYAEYIGASEPVDTVAWQSGR